MYVVLSLGNPKKWNVNIQTFFENKKKTQKTQGHILELERSVISC